VSCPVLYFFAIALLTLYLLPSPSPFACRFSPPVLFSIYLCSSLFKSFFLPTSYFLQCHCDHCLQSHSIQYLFSESCHSPPSTPSLLFYFLSLLSSLSCLTVADSPCNYPLQANFVIGIGDLGANVYCVDFGLSKRYRHPKTLQHIPHRDGRSLTGTPRYARCALIFIVLYCIVLHCIALHCAHSLSLPLSYTSPFLCPCPCLHRSINNHLGIEQSRRDDLESIAYILVSTYTLLHFILLCCTLLYSILLYPTQLHTIVSHPILSSHAQMNPLSCCTP
jgi:hypothetical protein